MADLNDSVIVTTTRKMPSEETANNPLTTTGVAVTPDHQPDIVWQYISPFRSILIRSMRVFLQTLVSGSGLSGIGQLTSIDVLKHLKPEEILILATAAAALCAAQNLIELLNNWDQKFPLLRG